MSKDINRRKCLSLLGKLGARVALFGPLGLLTSDASAQEFRDGGWPIPPMKGAWPTGMWAYADYASNCAGYESLVQEYGIHFNNLPNEFKDKKLGGYGIYPSFVNVVYFTVNRLLPAKGFPIWSYTIYKNMGKCLIVDQMNNGKFCKMFEQDEYPYITIDKQRYGIG